MITAATSRPLNRLRHSFRNLSWRKSNTPCASLDGLHIDLLTLIFDFLSWPQDFYALALVSRTLGEAATPALYRTIVVVRNPRAVLGLLSRLDRDAELCSLVQTLVFDNEIRAVHPQLRASELILEKAKAKDLTDTPPVPAHSGEQSGDPHRIRLRLHTVLPKLRNLQEIYVKRWDHILQGPLSASECYHYWSPTGYEVKKLAKKDLVGRVRSHFAPQPIYRGPPSVMHGDRQPCPLDIISLLLLRCEHISKVCVVGVFPSMKLGSTHQSFAHTKLTTLILGESSTDVVLWNRVLRHCKALKVLGLLNVFFRIEKLMAGCHFPDLESIEWYGYSFSALSGRKKSAKPFVEFILKHSATLKCLALAPRLYQPLRGQHYDGGLPFFNPDSGLLPHLETLRLINWSVFVPEHDSWPHTESTQFRSAAENLCQFVESRPGLVDLTIADLPRDLEARLCNTILAGRKMKRLLVGEGLRRSREMLVPPIDFGRLPSGFCAPGMWMRRRQDDWLSTRKREYMQEAWQSYEVMFAGLALEKSAYRPTLMSSKCPRSWMDYLRIHHSL